MSYQDWVEKIIAVIRLFFIQSKWKGPFFLKQEDVQAINGTYNCE